MGGFRRWSSVEALELKSWSRRDAQDRTPLLGRAEKPSILRSKSFQPTIFEEGDFDTPDFNRPHIHFKDPSVSDAADSSTVEVSTAPLSLQKTLPEVPYHVFDRRQKRWMVYIVSFAGLFSPLSSNIYFPALGNIARTFHATNAQVALTITIYMIFQGLAPSFWGSWADTVGRRPVFIGTFLVYLASNIALALSPNLSVLMAFRALQAIGSSATISIGAGVISDITIPAERGGLIGTFGGIRMLGQAVGPAFGGLLTQYLGFRSIFWFLFILGFAALSTIVILLPETLRNLAGNGTIYLHGWRYRPLSYRLLGLPEPVLERRDPEVAKSKQKFNWGEMITGPARMLCEKDVFVTLLFGSVVYAVWSMVTASTTHLFQARYHLNDLTVGFAFLPNGLGCVSGSYLTGRLLDHDFHVTEAHYRRDHNIPLDAELGVKKARGVLLDFPIERARLRSMWWHIIIFIATTAAYGFSLSTHLVVPLLLQFLLAYTATAIFASNSTLLIDLYPNRSASATAVNNLARCSVGAAGVAVIDVLLARWGARVTFGGLAAVVGVVAPCVGVEWVWGGRWRGGREGRG